MCCGELLDYVSRYAFDQLDRFFFKQKTAYELRISDWSSDVALPISSLGVTRPREASARLGKPSREGASLLLVRPVRPAEEIVDLAHQILEVKGFRQELRLRDRKSFV